MKALVLRQCAPIDSAPLEMLDLPDPTPGPGEVRLRVRACGICRTDLHVIEGELPPLDHPVIPGHQVVGVVDRLGEGVSRFQVGDRVGVAWLRHTCGTCGYCRSDRENLCEAAVFSGYQAPGGFSEYTVIDQHYAYALAPVFEDARACPLLCAGIIGYRSLKRSQCRKGDTLALYGFGSSAHLVIQIALHWGCTVYVVSRNHHHQQLALELGAGWAGSHAEHMPGPADSAIIFAPAGELVPAALGALRKGGTLALAGIYMTSVPTLDYEQHLFFEKNIHSVTANTRQDGIELLELAARIPLRPQVQLYPMEQANQALLALKHDQIQGSGVLVWSTADHDPL